MKAVFYSVETKSEPWVSDAKQTYEKKLRPFFPFEIESIKSASLERSEAEAKKKAEADKILKLIKPNDYLILFDEAGKAFANSEVFAQQFGRVMESSPSRLVFLIGGAFGVDESVRRRARAMWSLGPLTFNHWVAQIAALEQIYRAMTIIKKIPYHNR